MLKLGDDFKLYLDTASSWATPTWVELNSVDDLGIDPSPIVAQINQRGRGYVGGLRGRLDAKLSAKIWYKAGDSDFDTLEDAAWDGTQLHLALADGDIAESGTNYWEGELIVSGFPLGSNFDEGAAYDIEFMPDANSTNEPRRATTA